MQPFCESAKAAAILAFFLAPRWPLFYHGGVDIGLCVCLCYGMAKLLVPQVLSPAFLQSKIESFHGSHGDASKQNGYGLGKAFPPKKHSLVGLWPFIVIASPISRIITPKTPMYKSIYKDIPPHL